MGTKPGVAPQQRRSSPSREAGWAVQQHRCPRSDERDPQQRITTDCSGNLENAPGFFNARNPAEPGAQPRVVCCYVATPLHEPHTPGEARRPGATNCRIDLPRSVCIKPRRAKRQEFLFGLEILTHQEPGEAGPHNLWLYCLRHYVAPLTFDLLLILWDILLQV